MRGRLALPRATKKNKTFIKKKKNLFSGTFQQTLINIIYFNPK